jgi:ATP-dependent Clp protease adaptor protein ClpS
MSDQGRASVEDVVVSRNPETGKRTKTREKTKNKPRRQPRYHVVLWDDDDHSYEYVITMMMELFGHSPEEGLKIAESVDRVGRAVCMTTTLERAELKRDQIHAYGRDRLIPRCSGSMTASIEPESSE